MDNFAKNIKYLRLRAGLKQSEAAIIVGSTRTAWTEYELGSSKPRFADLLRIVDYFDISLSELVEIDLQNVNPNDILEFQKLFKKVKVKVKVSVNLNSGNTTKHTQVRKGKRALEPVVLEQLNRMENELKELRSKLAQ